MHAQGINPKGAIPLPNVRSGAIGNQVITSNYQVEYMSYEEYITEITSLGLIACWMTL